MSAIRVFILVCNEPGCEAVTDYACGDTKLAAQAEARDLGWHTTRRADFCPQHKQQPWEKRILDALPI